MRDQLTPEQALNRLHAGKEVLEIVGDGPDDPVLRFYVEDSEVKYKVLTGWSRGLIAPLGDLDDDHVFDYLNSHKRLEVP